MKEIPQSISKDRQLNQAQSQIAQGIRQMGLQQREFQETQTALQDAQDTLTSAQAQLAATMSALSTTIQNSAILNGNLRTGISLSTGGTAVAHGLGRQPQGFIVCGLSNPASIAGDPSVADATNIVLQASTSVTARIYFF